MAQLKKLMMLIYFIYVSDVLAVNAKLFEKRRIEVASVAPIVKLSTKLLR